MRSYPVAVLLIAVVVAILLFQKDDLIEARGSRGGGSRSSGTRSSSSSSSRYSRYSGSTSYSWVWLIKTFFKIINMFCLLRKPCHVPVSHDPPIVRTNCAQELLVYRETCLYLLYAIKFPNMLKQRCHDFRIANVSQGQTTYNDLRFPKEDRLLETQINVRLRLLAAENYLRLAAEKHLLRWKHLRPWERLQV